MLAGPATSEMLALCREQLASAVLPGLEGKPRYDLLMVLSALGMVERELADAGAGGAEAVDILRFLLLRSTPNTELARWATVTALDAEIARQIRAGCFDGEPLRSELHRALRAVNALALARVNPIPEQIAGKQGGVIA